MASPAVEGEAAQAPPACPAPTFLDLPVETQHQIFSHCHQSDLICLALVSRHFRDLAATQIYRQFHIVFPDEDDPTFETPIDSLASGLDTFVASDYDYAQHLRDISLDTLSAGDKAENAYKAYLYSASCGKFMNSLLLLTLRRAKALETFKWNIRVELSRPVYQALHAIPSLNHLHLRLQEGPSLFEAPPPLPFASSSSSTHSVGDFHTPAHLGPPPPLPMAPGLPPMASLSYSSSLGMPPALPSPPKLCLRPKRKTAMASEPSTLSAFNKLKSLAVLDIDDLDCVPELKACVKNSSLSLQKLKLSFSTRLALQSRKPNPDFDHDDEDPDDDFQVVPLPPSGPNWDEAAPVKAFRAQEQRKAQEAVFGRIFDYESQLKKKSAKPLTEKEDKQQSPVEKKEDTEPEAPGKREATAAEKFMDRLHEVSAKLLAETQVGADDSEESKQAILDLIQDAAKKYLESEDAKASAASSDDDKAGGHPSTDPEEGATNDVSETQPKQSTSASSASKKEASPDDIDVEEPIGSEETDEGADMKTVGAEKTIESSPPKSAAQIPLQSTEDSSKELSQGTMTLQELKVAQRETVAKLKHIDEQTSTVQTHLHDIRSKGEHRDENLIQYLEEQLHDLQEQIEEAQKGLRDAEVKIQNLEKSTDGTSSSTDDQDACVRDYIRATRGLSLRSFSAHLIPVKAAVLKASVDIHVLQRLTLLNVGNQAPIWSMLSRENKHSPLPLRKIFTDHVSIAFMSCVAQLEKVTELFILERADNYKPESFAPRSGATIDHIRRHMLRKHMPWMEKLLIKNDLHPNWDADEKTVLLLCNRGRNLKELTISMGVHAMHTFMQHMPRLVTLYALHVAHFRSDDACPWVIRETHRFLVDNLSHHPQLKLEWICIDDDYVQRIVRDPYGSDNSPEDGDGDGEKKKRKKKQKDKGKAAATLGSFGTGSSAYPPLPLPDGLASPSDSEDEDTDICAHTRLETTGNYHFYDVWNVRIFKKEVLGGRL